MNDAHKILYNKINIDSIHNFTNEQLEQYDSSSSYSTDITKTINNQISLKNKINRDENSDEEYNKTIIKPKIKVKMKTKIMLNMNRIK